MEITIFSGEANPPLAEAIAARVGMPLGRRIVARFPDSELHVEIQQSVRGHDVYLVQPTSPPVDLHLMELLFMADACYRAGAQRITAIVPYLGYARQDRRGKGREPVGARLTSDFFAAAHIARVVAVDLHTDLEGFMSIPLEHLSAVPILARTVAPLLAENSIVVSPDLGGVKLAERYARSLELPMAVVHKARLSGREVEVRGIVGDVAGRSPVIVDDMVTTAGTVDGAIRAVIAAGAVPEALVVASHGLLAGGEAVQRLGSLPIRRLVFSDSVKSAAHPSLPIEVATIAPLLAEAIKLLHGEQSLSDLIVHQ